MLNCDLIGAFISPSGDALANIALESWKLELEINVPDCPNLPSFSGVIFESAPAIALTHSAIS